MVKLKKFYVKGVVINTDTQKGLGGAKVEAWDKDKVYDDLLGVAFTSRQGKFQLEFNENYYREFAKEIAPDIYFKVFWGNKLIKNTEDSVIVDAKSKSETTIEVELPKREPVGNDRINTLQMLQRVRFLQKSDFLGAISETGARTNNVFGFATDMVKNSILKMDLQPMQAKVRAGDVVNQDVASATNSLRQKEVTVNEVKAYQPGANTQSLKDLSAFPARLPPGTKVDLYEENGQVKYFSVVKDSKLDTGNTAEIQKELDTIKAEKAAMDTELNALKAEMEILNQERASTDAINAELSKLNSMYQDLTLSIASDKPVVNVAGVDAQLDTKLRDLNIRTVGELSLAKEEDLISAGISDTQAKAVIDAAKSKLHI